MTRPTIATSFRTPTTHRTCGDLRSSIRGTWWCFNYVYDLPFFKDATKLSAESCWADGRSAASNQFQTGTPCGVGVNNDYAGVGEVGSFGCGSEGQFWNMNGTPSIMGNSPTHGAASPNQYFATTIRRYAHFHGAGYGNIQSAEGRPRLDLSARLPGLESRLVQEVRVQRAQRHRVSRGSVRRQQPSELGRSEIQPDLVHLRQSDLQNRSLAQLATLSAILLLSGTANQNPWGRPSFLVACPAAQQPLHRLQPVPPEFSGDALHHLAPLTGTLLLEDPH